MNIIKMVAIAISMLSFCFVAYAEEAYTASMVPENMTVKEKKHRFIVLVTPAIKSVYDELMAQYNDVSKLLAKGQSNADIEALKKEYKATTDEELLMALKPHPQSIAIAQAAMESAWATSHFFKDANNVFGMWSFNEDEPRIAAGEHRGDKTIWLKKYASIEDSAHDYYRDIARGSAYKELRELRMTTDDPYVLVKALDHYSEIGSKYGEQLAAMIKYNKFYEYD